MLTTRIGRMLKNKLPVLKTNPSFRHTTGPAFQEGARICGRYLLQRELGGGGGGSVYRALDTETGEIVALKFIGQGEDPERALREQAALRALQIPGVVKLLHSGAWEGRIFLVMEWLDALPFPGHLPPSWEAIRPLLHPLLHILSRVHAAGVIHRDLKPGTVLIRQDGTPILVDFGIARGPGLGRTLTRTGMILGTPRYLAPEQVCGEPIDARTDLYALATMVYEVLAGRPPFRESRMMAQMRARLTQSPPPIHQLVPSLPSGVARLIDRMLARYPQDRPSSAEEVLHILEDASAPAARENLPWLGSEEALQATLDAMARGGAVDVVGPPGSGRTRMLQELAARQHRVQHLPSGKTAFDALIALTGAPPPSLGRDAAFSWIHSQLDALAEAGVWLVVDDADALPPRAASVVYKLTQRVLRGWSIPTYGAAFPPPSCPLSEGWILRLAPLSASDLAPLFTGADRLYHLQEDAARLLYRRTGGLPRMLLPEMHAWVGAGQAHWAGGNRLLVERAGLHQLALLYPARPPAPPPGRPCAQAHAALAVTIGLLGGTSTMACLQPYTPLPPWELEATLQELHEIGCLADNQLVWAPEDLRDWPVEARQRLLPAAAHPPIGSPLRFRLLIQGGWWAEASQEAVALSARLFEEARLQPALMVAVEGLGAAREGKRPAEELALLEQMVRIVVSPTGDTELRRVLLELDRTPEAPSRALSELLEALQRLLHNKVGEALERAQELPPFLDATLEAARLDLQGRTLLQRLPLEAHALFRALRPQALAFGGEGLPLLSSWRALLAWREGRFIDAATLWEEAARSATRPLQQLAWALEAAYARKSAGQPREAERLALRCQEQAARLRIPPMEGRAASLLRWCAWQRGDVLPPDLPLVEAIQRMDQGAWLGQVMALEAVAAWKANRTADALRLLQHLQTLPSPAPSALLLWQVLEQLVRSRSAPAAFSSLAARCLAGPLDRFKLQALALMIGWCGPAIREALTLHAEEVEHAIPTPYDLRWEVFTGWELRACLL